MSAPVGKLLLALVSWAPAIVRAVKTWTTPAERDAQRRHEQIELDYQRRKRELDRAPPARRP